MIPGRTGVVLSAACKVVDPFARTTELAFEISKGRDAKRARGTDEPPGLSQGWDRPLGMNHGTTKRSMAAPRGTNPGLPRDVAYTPELHH